MENMSRQIEVRGKILLITLQGSFGNSAQDFYQEMVAQEAELSETELPKYERIVIDLKKVTAMSSSGGLAILVGLNTIAKKAGHQKPIALIVNENDHIRQALATTKLIQFFELFAILEKYLESN